MTKGARLIFLLIVKPTQLALHGSRDWHLNCRKEKFTHHFLIIIRLPAFLQD
jgi:hypothetical protein